MHKSRFSVQYMTFIDLCIRKSANFFSRAVKYINRPGRLSYLKGQCHENVRLLIEGLCPYKEPLTGFTFFRPLQAKEKIIKVFHLDVKIEGEDFWL